MDFEQVNSIADRISKGENSGLYEQLVRECVPYCLYLKQKLGFLQILDTEVAREFAADAVSDAIIVKENRGLPFAICLHNTFRDRCRQIYRSIRERAREDILKICEVQNPPSTIGTGPKKPSPPIQAERNEEKELFRNELENHEKFSKTLIYQRMRCLAYKEMAAIFDTTINECKRVFWHDFNAIKNKLRHRYVKDEDL